jgi:hypothetical protein
MIVVVSVCLADVMRVDTCTSGGRDMGWYLQLIGQLSWLPCLFVAGQGSA